MSSSLVILFGLVKQFGGFWPPPPRHTLSVYTVHLVWEGGKGGGGGQREDRGAAVHKYSSFVHGGNSSQAGSKIQTNE